MELAKVEPGNVSAKDVGFKIIPRLNAPGRVDHAQPALDLLLAKDLLRAREMAKALEGYNKLRQSMGRKVFQEAAAQVVGDTPIIFAFDMNWPAGVVGLAANQLAKKYNRPALVVGGNGRHAVGSGRSPKGYNILDLLAPHKETFLAMGGHAQAAGFSLEPDLLESVQKLFWEADVAMPTDANEPMIVDAVLGQELISWDMAEMLKKFEPFGEGNPQPKFIFKDMPVVNARTVGKESQHAKMTFEVDGKPVEGIGFSLGDVLPTLGAYADVVATPAVTHYMGRSRLELSIEDMAPAGKVPILAA
jgi:single-stranded-DNA-specific exonuclease